jgi:hypothetical protein
MSRQGINSLANSSSHLKMTKFSQHSDLAKVRSLLCNFIEHQIWIQRDGTEDGIANDLIAAGIPKRDIVIAFHPPELRAYTEYAAI